MVMPNGLEKVISELQLTDNKQAISLIALRVVLKEIYSELSESQKIKIAENLRDKLSPNDENKTHESKRQFELLREETESILGVQLER